MPIADFRLPSQIGNRVSPALVVSNLQSRICNPNYNQYAFMTPSLSLKRQVSEAIAACQDKKAEQVTILELEKGSGAFTDYFVICSGTNPRQIQAIADAVDERLESLGLRPAHTEGYKQAEWVLLDYVDFVVHIFSENARRYYDLERLWKTAQRLEPGELTAKRHRTGPAGTSAPRPRRKKA